jgi:hypothetical protein
MIHYDTFCIRGRYVSRSKFCNLANSKRARKNVKKVHNLQVWNLNLKKTCLIQRPGFRQRVPELHIGN